MYAKFLLILTQTGEKCLFPIKIAAEPIWTKLKLPRIRRLIVPIRLTRLYSSLTPSKPQFPSMQNRILALPEILFRFVEKFFSLRWKNFFTIAIIFFKPLKKFAKRLLLILPPWRRLSPCWRNEGRVASSGRVRLLVGRGCRHRQIRSWECEADSRL